MSAPPVRPAVLLEGMQELARERPLPVTVRGSCMAPAFADGEPVEIAPARFYWPGDVVAFQGPDGRLRLHRLLGYRLVAGRRGGLACVTRGDGCPCHDAPVPLSLLLGRATGPTAPAARLRAVLGLLRIALRRLARPA